MKTIKELITKMNTTFHNSYIEIGLVLYRTTNGNEINPTFTVHAFPDYHSQILMTIRFETLCVSITTFKNYQEGIPAINPEKKIFYTDDHFAIDLLECLANRVKSPPFVADVKKTLESLSFIDEMGQKIIMRSL